MIPVLLRSAAKRKYFYNVIVSSQKLQKKISGPVFNPFTVLTAVAPSRAAAAATNPSLQKMSVPSIPSRFLTPIIDVTAADSEG